jgi:hypothetical protein
MSVRVNNSDMSKITRVTLREIIAVRWKGFEIHRSNPACYSFGVKHFFFTLYIHYSILTSSRKNMCIYVEA